MLPRATLALLSAWHSPPCRGRCLVSQRLQFSTFYLSVHACRWSLSSGMQHGLASRRWSPTHRTCLPSSGTSDEVELLGHCSFLCVQLCSAQDDLLFIQTDILYLLHIHANTF
jgi:hypothetical protein